MIEIVMTSKLRNTVVFICLIVCTIIITITIFQPKAFSKMKVPVVSSRKDGHHHLYASYNSSFDMDYPPHQAGDIFLAADLLTLCESHDLLALVVIFSVAEHSEKRQIIRETWCSPEIQRTQNIRCLFVFGVTDSGFVHKQLLLELNTHRDILIADFTDSYRNLTLKTLAALRWVNASCRGSDFVVKADDDVYLNTFDIGSLLNRNVTEYYAGYKWTNVRPERTESHKWFVSKDLYSKLYYPPYCAGPCYILSRSLIEHILDMSQMIRIIPVEDVFIGLCLENHVKITHIDELYPLSTLGSNDVRKPCDEVMKHMMVHHIDQEILVKLWERNLLCHRTMDRTHDGTSHRPRTTSATVGMESYVSSNDGQDT